MSTLKYCMVSFIVFVGIAKNVFSEIRIYFFDVGQGNCILLRNGKNAILIDAGGSKSFDTIKKSFRKCLAGIKISGIILTHQDKDHRNLIEAIEKAGYMKEGYFLFSITAKGRYLTSNRTKELYSSKTLGSWQTELNKLFPEGTFNFLKANWEKIPAGILTSNDTCLVFSFEYNSVKTLFTGDSTGKAFDHYVGQCTNAKTKNEDCDYNREVIAGTHIFVMPHHGSDQNESWRWTLNVTKESPNLLATIINVDPNGSPYKHPRAWIRDITWPPSMEGELHEIVYNRGSIFSSLEINDNLFITGSRSRDHFIEILINQNGIYKKEDGNRAFICMKEFADIINPPRHKRSRKSFCPGLTLPQNLTDSDTLRNL